MRCGIFNADFIIGTISMSIYHIHFERIPLIDLNEIISRAFKPIFIAELI